MQINIRITVTSCLLIACFTMLSCSGNKTLSEHELKTYILDDVNGLRKTISKGDIDIEITYKPAELVWVQELKASNNELERRGLKRSYDSLSYFILRFSRKGHEIENAFVSDPSRFSQIINYLSFDMSEDLYLVQEGDSIRALDVIYTRSFGGDVGTSVMAVFDGDFKGGNDHVKVCFNDTMLGVGSTEFEFDARDITNTPTLTLN